MAESELAIDVSKLKGKKVMLATPMYGGLGNTMYMSSVLQLQDQFLKRGIFLYHCFMMNESLIDRARNGLVDEFLSRSDADYLLFVDADIQFRPEDVMAMMTYERDIICAPYPKKHINWPVIIRAIKSGIDDVDVLEKLVGEYVFTPLEDSYFNEEIVKVSEAGTGLMLIHRSVFKKMMEAYPENYYECDDAKAGYYGKRMYAFFRTEIHEKRYLSEDYYFCKKWRDMGGDVWLFPWAQTVHFGAYGFQGSVGHLIDTIRRIGEFEKREQ